MWSRSRSPVVVSEQGPFQQAFSAPELLHSAYPVPVLNYVRHPPHIRHGRPHKKLLLASRQRREYSGLFRVPFPLLPAVGHGLFPRAENAGIPRAGRVLSHLFPELLAPVLPYRVLWL